MALNPTQAPAPPEEAPAVDLAPILARRHPHWVMMARSCSATFETAGGQPVTLTTPSRWSRYRAFGALIPCDGMDPERCDLDDPNVKALWLPKGAQESDANYATRISLTHNLGWSAPAIARMSGSLTKAGSSVSYPETSAVNAAHQEALGEFRANADGNGRSMDSWWGDFLPVVLQMGLSGAEVCRDDQGADPYVCRWDAEEIVDWECDARGSPIWVKLRRAFSPAEDWTTEREDRVMYRILTRTEGIVYEGVESVDMVGLPVSGGAFAETIRWTHGLGMVPFTPAYAKRIKPFLAASYVDGISRGDWRALQLESDQGLASWLHGSPLLALGTDRTLAEVGVGAGQALKLNPGAGPDKEWAEYLTTDTSGMLVREGILDRTHRQSLSSAGIDAEAMFSTGTDRAGAARSGVSIAMAHSTSEAPTLAALAEEMDAAEGLIMEIAYRYLTGGNADPHLRTWDGNVVRPRKWDMMAPTEAATTATLVWDMVKSETYRRATAKDLAGKVPGNIDEETLATIHDEIDAADYEVKDPLEEAMKNMPGAPAGPPDGAEEPDDEDRRNPTESDDEE